MKKIMMTGAAVMLAGLVYSQKDSTLTVLDDVTVTANKMEQKQSTTGKVIGVISKADIEKKSAGSLAQVLNEQAGLIVNGALSNAGSTQSLYMRGASLGRTLVLVDGVPVYDPSLITSEFDLNFISLNDVERIEICKGAQSTLYGSDAVAGVINIITAKADTTKPFNLKATGVVGSYNTYKGNVQLSGSVKGLSYSVRYAKLVTDGFSTAYDSTGKGNFDKDGYNADVTGANIGYAFTSKLSAKAYINYSKYKSDIDAASFRDEKDFTINNRSLMSGALLSYKSDNLNIVGKYQYSDVSRKYFNDSLDVPGFNKFETNDYFGRNQFAEIYGNYNIGKHLKVLHGADYRFSSMNNQYFSISSFGDYASEFKDTSVKQFSIYTSLVFTALESRLNIEVGGRYNEHSRYGSNYTYTFNPSFAINDHLRVFGSIASGFKAPSLYQLYAPYAGNKDLKAEKSTNYEIGIQQQHAIFSNRLVYFYRDITDGIDYNYVLFQYFNYTRQKVDGVEWETIFKPTAKLTVKANYTYLHSKESTQSRENFSDTSYTYLLRRPKHSINANIGYQATRALYTSVGTKYVSDRYDAGGYMMPDVKLGSYFLVNAYAEYSFKKHIKLFADAQNITNTKFFEVNGYNAIPFIISAGITFTL